MVRGGVHCLRSGGLKQKLSSYRALEPESRHTSAGGFLLSFLSLFLFFSFLIFCFILFSRQGISV